VTVRVLVYGDAATASKQGAALIGDAVRAAIAARGLASVAISGGRTPWDMLRLLASEEIAWSDVHVWQTDERVVPADDPNRTWTQLGGALLSRVALPATHAHPMPVDTDDLSTSSAQYASLLERIAGAPAVLDLVHVGLGADGHAASLMPNDAVLDVETRDVGLTGPYDGYRRMTLTYPIINRAREILWLVTGEAKAEALRRLCAGDQSIPAGRINQARATIVADRAAASRVALR